MKRSGEFWLNCLSDDVREKWLNNYDPHYSCNYKEEEFRIPLSDYLKKEMNYKTFILQAFYWHKNEKGYYWGAVSDIDEDKLIQQLRYNKLKQLGLLQKRSGTL